MSAIRQAGVAGLAATLMSSAMFVSPTQAAPKQPVPRKTEPAAATRSPADTVAVADRDRVLPRGWRSSDDLAWTTNGDADGLHILAATAKSGYTWRTVANLSEPGFDVDQWIGNACLTGSGRRLVVVYAPRTFTNKPQLFDRGGFTAVVDLLTGDVTKLKVQTSLAYFNPGCGTGETAVLTQMSGEKAEPAGVTGTRLRTVNAVKGSLSQPIEVAGELSSAVPVRGGLVAAAAGSVVRVARDGTTRAIARATGTPFRLIPDRDGGVVFLDQAGDRVRINRTTPTASVAKPATAVAEGPVTDLGVVAGAGGRVFITGRTDRLRSLPSTVTRLDVAKGATVSSRGAVALTAVSDRPATGSAMVNDVRVEAKVVSTGARLEFGITPESELGAGDGRAVSPALGGSAPKVKAAAAAGSPTNPVEAERWCSVPRNDPGNQAMQPKPRQVEWAVDQAITNSLTLTRPANWKNLGMPAYSPQALFPSIPLAGGGRVPAQVMLGVIAQESNMWQAARFALPGVTANPLIGNFYGRDIYNDTADDDWDIRWEDADCGYGVAQVTDGMRLAGHEKPGETSYPYQTQRAVALDFATNVAAGLRILQSKWNQTHSAGLTVNNADPARIENWFFALWAYNTGFYPNKNDGSPWGVGWANNPINPRYDPQRKPFLEYTYEDARNPQLWPYPEKVIGWAGHPVEIPESPYVNVAGYRAAWWSTVAARVAAKPDPKLFCNASNNCDPNAVYVPNAPETIGEKPGPCGNKNSAGQYDLKCWFHQPVAWSGTPGGACDCGNEVLRFDPGYAYQADGASFPPVCTLTGLPAGASVIDNVPNGTPSVREGCAPTWTSAGSFGLRFASDAGGEYPSKVDFHQIGGGFGSHFWFSYTHKAADYGGRMAVTGQWTINPTNKWTRLFVHVPDQGAYTRQADYKIYLPGQSTPTKHRSVPTRWQKNMWLDLGVFDFRGAGTPKVELSNVSKDGSGEHKIVWDAIAVQPLAAKPAHFVVAMGDSFSSGDGGGEYTRVSDQYADDRPFKNSCRRSPNAWSRRVVIPGTPNNSAIGGLADSRDPQLDFHHIACSGAQTYHVLSTTTRTGAPAPANASGEVPRDTTNGELNQMDQGFLDENTTLVLLTIGGNDAKWTDLSRACAFDDCAAPGYKLEGDTVPMREAVPARLQGPVASDVRRVIAEIRERAPNAWIVQAGYPQLFKSGTSYDLNPLPGVSIGISPDEVDFINDMARVAATNMLVSDAANKVNGVDVRADFAGHELGTADTTENWLNGYIVGDRFREADDDGEKNDSLFGGGSFHPTVRGFRAYGEAVSNRLSVLGYRWS